MVYPTRIRYGLRLLVNIASRAPGERVSIQALASEEKISGKYLEQIVNALRPLRALQAVRGAHGGYVLVKKASEISLGEVFKCLGGMAYPVPCLPEDD